MTRAASEREAERRLTERLDDLLDDSLGLNIYPRLPRLKQRPWLARLTGLLALSPRPFIAGPQMAALYLFGFAVIPWLAFRFLWGEIPLSLWPLIVLQLYGALWSGWATTSTRLAHRSIMGVIARELLPAMSEPALDKVREELDRRFARRKILLLSWGLGAIAAALAGILIYQDLAPRFRLSRFEIFVWWLGWTLLYTTSAKVVIVSRFYETFADALDGDEQRLFWLNPAASPVIASTALVAKRMLLFWLAIMVSIALVLPFGDYFVDLAGGERLLDQRTAPPLDALTFADLDGSRFVIVHLLGTAMFSIGIGSLVFLRCEAGLRSAARRATTAALLVIEKEVAGLHERTSLADCDLKRLAELGSLHAAVAGGASYHAFLLSALSLVIPFVPLLTLLLNLWPS